FRSSTFASCRRRSASPTAPRRTQACGVPVTVAGSVWPSKASTKKSRPEARHASMTRTGNWPPPASTPSLVIVRFRLADRPRRIAADEGDDFHHRLRILVQRGDVVETLGHRAFMREQQA